jgi:hypothetical protein
MEPTDAASGVVILNPEGGNATDRTVDPSPFPFPFAERQCLVVTLPSGFHLVFRSGVGLQRLLALERPSAEVTGELPVEVFG